MCPKEPKQKKRKFKGIWIPRELYFADELNWTEKILLLEIDSLDNEGGCYASNKYFANFLGKSKRYITKCIGNLKDLGYIYKKQFDGRKRILKSRLKVLFQADPNYSSGEGGTIVPGRPEEKFHHINKGYSNKDYIIKDEEERTHTHDISNITNIYSYYVGGTISGHQFQLLKAFVEDDEIELPVIELAFKLAAEKGKNKFSYANHILKNWRDGGVKTLPDAEQKIKEFEEAKKNGGVQKENRGKKEEVEEESIFRS